MLGRNSALLVLLPLLLSCGGKSVEVGDSKRPTILGGTCDLAKKESAPLIVDWSSSKRSRLESAVRKGVAVPARVNDCDIEPMWQCELPAKYGYEQSSVRREAERIADSGSLYARVPTSAVALEARLEAGSELQVQKTTVGRFSLDSLAMAENQLRGQCEGATHFISGVDVGAFEFAAMRQTEVAAEVKAGNAGGGASKSSEHEVLSADGTLAACEQPDTQANGCQAPIQIDLTPLVPSLTKDEFIAAAAKATQDAYKACYVDKKLGGQVGVMATFFAVANQNGSVELWNPWGSSYEPVYFECVSRSWGEIQFEPFDHPPLVLEAMIYDLSIQPYEDLEQVLEKIAKFYTHNANLAEPGVPPEEIGKQVNYDYAALGLSPTSQWQYPWRW